MIGGQLLFLFVHCHRLALVAHQHFIFGIVKVLGSNFALVAACSQKRRLVYQVGQVGAGKTGRSAGHHGQIDVFGKRHFAHMHLQNFLAAFHVGIGHHHLPVKTSRPQKRRIQNVRPVGRGDQNNVFVLVKTVHFHQQLV